LGENINTKKEMVEVTLVISRETGLELKTEKALFIFMCPQNNAGQNRNFKDS
jgi:hypothetical protein